MPNRLAAETSPYLLQHADNPVDWYPWGPEAFAAAKAGDKPVLLSIGYSACHWCHVMAHESFEDEAVAALMNRLFVNVKVDREERPDVDKIYQIAHQLLAQRGGGWPLTMFLNPEDQRPFFGGTYFPKEARYGMPAFPELLQSVAKYYAERRPDVIHLGERIDGVFAEITPAPVGLHIELTPAPFGKARKHFSSTFDREFGGFGGAPKFPHPSMVERLLRAWRTTARGAEPDLESLSMAALTLTRMAEGGLYDHLGGGFCRYAVDRYWLIPHFEKMLYDNGPLLALYADAHAATGEPLFAEVAEGIAGWMLDDMQAANGGFFSSRDADSEGEEGRYYVWTREEVEALLPAEDYPLFARRFGLDRAPNFEGRYHLAVHESLEDIARAHDVPLGRVEERLAAARARLLDARCRRVPPGRDEKQLTSWNALAIRGLAIAARRLGRLDWLLAAERAVQFLAAQLLVDGRLLASYKDGRARFAAYLDDHAFLIDAILEVLQARWDSRLLALATTLAELLLQHYEDRSDGGFFFTADDSESLMHRSKPYADEALPSGNGVAAFALQRLGFLLGETRYLEAAERTLRAAWRAISEHPHGHVTLLNALEEYRQHPEIVVLRGPREALERWRSSADHGYTPRRLVFAIAADETALPGALAERGALADRPVAYRCVGTHCELPETDLEALVKRLEES